MEAPEDAGEHSEALTAILRRFPSGWPTHIGVGPGWYPIICELDARLAEIKPDYEVHQVKEKFGGLRYYVGVETEAMRDLIDAAETRSYTVCEVTGSPGVLMRRGHWFVTRDPQTAPDGYEVVTLTDPYDE